MPIDEAAETSGLEPYTIRNMISSRAIRAVKDPEYKGCHGRYLVSPDEIKQVVAKRRTGNGRRSSFSGNGRGKDESHLAEEYEKPAADFLKELEGLRVANRFLKIQNGELVKEAKSLRGQLAQYENGGMGVNGEDNGLQQYWGLLRKHAHSGAMSSVFEILDKFHNPEYLDVILGDKPGRREFIEMRQIAEGGRAVSPEDMARFMEIYKANETRRDVIAREFSRNPKGFLMQGFHDVTRYEKETHDFTFQNADYRRESGQDGKGRYVLWAYKTGMAVPASIPGILERAYCRKHSLDVSETINLIRR